MMWRRLLAVSSLALVLCYIRHDVGIQHQEPVRAEIPRETKVPLGVRGVNKRSAPFGEFTAHDVQQGIVFEVNGPEYIRPLPVNPESKYDAEKVKAAVERLKAVGRKHRTSAKVDK
jgi:hypothetical protein